MLLWQLTFVSLSITAVLGLYLFCAYTFRVRMYYPLAVVTGHVVSAAVTVVLFCLLQVQVARSAGLQSYIVAFSWFSFGAVILTFVSGLYFYVRFNARRRGLRTGLLATHLVMASLSFAFALGSIAGVAQSRPAPNAELHHSSMYNFWKHHNR